jgi:hypothetical protein
MSRSSETHYGREDHTIESHALRPVAVESLPSLLTLCTYTKEIYYREEVYNRLVNESDGERKVNVQQREEDTRRSRLNSR